MILSSNDGGATWNTKHVNENGEVLTDISFVDDKVGFATGTGGLMLWSTDGGESWKVRQLHGFLEHSSFGDAANGIAIFRQDGGSASTTRITHDGGESWQDVVFDSDELRSYSDVVDVVALDGSHYLMLRRQPNVADVLIATKDSGKTWTLALPRDDASDRELPRQMFVHSGEYWAFGMELVHREKGGGYGVPMVLHSKEGENWKHGAAGPSEFESCNWEGCYLWDGAVESLYGEHERFWSMPQDGSLSTKWAIAGTAACTVNVVLRCAAAVPTDKPLPRPEVKGVVYSDVSTRGLAEGCLQCDVKPIVPDAPVGSLSMTQLRAVFTKHRDGTVGTVSVVLPSKRMSGLIAEQLSAWLFEPTHSGNSTVESKTEVPLVFMCAGFPGQPETDTCTLHSSAEFSRH